MRWKSQEIGASEGRIPGLEHEPTVRTFDAPEALGIRFHEVEARSALNRVPPMSYVDFRWTINPYRGCTHACVYCFARPTHRYLDLDPGRDFEREIVVKVNLPEVLRGELRRPSWEREHVALGTNTDPYQWVEGRYAITRGVWQALLEARNPCSVLTKSPLLLRDLDLFRRLDREAGFAANLSIPTLDEKAWRLTEPATPHPRKRIEAVAELCRAGIETGVLVAPLMPGINDSPRQVEALLAELGEAGATSISGIALHLRGELKSLFMDWLRQYRPDLVGRYERLYEGRGNLTVAERRRLGRMIRRRPYTPNARGRRRPRPAARDQTPEQAGSSGPDPGQSCGPGGIQGSLFG